MSNKFLNNVRAKHLVLTECENKSKKEFADWTEVENLSIRNCVNIAPCFGSTNEDDFKDLCSSITKVCINNQKFTSTYNIFDMMSNLKHVILYELALDKTLFNIKPNYIIRKFEMVKCKTSVSGMFSVISEKFPVISQLLLVDNNYIKSPNSISTKFPNVSKLTIDSIILCSFTSIKGTSFDDLFKVFPNVEHFVYFQKSLKNKPPTDIKHKVISPTSKLVKYLNSKKTAVKKITGQLTK